MRNILLRALGAAACLALAGPALAQHGPYVGTAAPAAVPDTYKVGALVIEAPWIRATPGGAKVAGGYLRITNTGTTPDRLVGGSLAQAGKFSVHESSMADGIARMQPVENGLEIAPGASVELKPGGYHVMFEDLKAPMKQGDTATGTLVFEKAGPVEIRWVVRPIGAQDSGMNHGGMNGMGHAHPQ